MSERLNFTQANVAKLDPPASGRRNVRDAKVQGLVLSITANGTKSFYLYRRVRGKPSRILLGHFPSMTVELARDGAVKTYAKVIDGADPNEEKRTRRQGGLTLGDVFDDFLAKRTNVRGSATTATTHKSRFDTCLAEWRGRRLDSIRRAEVIALHVRLGGDRGHTTANRAVQLLRSLFNYAATSLNVEVPNLGGPGGVVPGVRRASVSSSPTSCRSSSRPWPTSPTRRCETSSPWPCTPGPGAGTCSR